MRMLGRIYLNILESIVNNNLWKELAEQADAYAYAKIGMSFDYHPDWHGVRDEKFAELIVRECCLYLENEAERLYGLSASEVDPLFQSNFEICAEKCYDNSKCLKEEFGVE
jgi:DUF438 domain-containing protein